MQKCAHLVELEKCCQTHIFLQIFVLVQPRTSPPKICKILLKFAKFANPTGSGKGCLVPGDELVVEAAEAHAVDGSEGAVLGDREGVVHDVRGLRRRRMGPAGPSSDRCCRVFGGPVLGCVETEFCK